MTKNQLNIRIDTDLSSKLDEHSEETGKTKTAIVSEAIASYLNVDTGTPDINDVVKRLERLERKFQKSPTPAPKKQNEPLQDDAPVQPDELGELITKKEAEALTGYSVNTLNRTFSQKGVHEVDKRGKAGLYRKSDIIDKIGFK